YTGCSCSAGQGRAGCGAEIGTNKVWQLTPQAPEVTNAKERTPAEIALQHKIDLMNLRVLEVRVEENDIFPACDRQSCEDLRKHWWRRRVGRRGWRKAQRVLTAWHAGVG